MTQISELFTPESAYKVIRQMMLAIDLDISKSPLLPGSRPIICNHDYVDLVVRLDEDNMPRLEIWTVEQSLLLTVEFEGADVTLILAPREKTGVMQLPSDKSMFNAVALYAKMIGYGNSYIDHQLKSATTRQFVTKVITGSVDA